MIENITIRPAALSDAQAISDCVNAAYKHYIPRIGIPPGPMLDDYEAVVQNHQVFVAVAGDSIVGALVLIHQPDGILLDNVAVYPSFQGQGYGKRLLQLAEQEAVRQGYAEIRLYTHEKMTENIALYTKIGYVETERRTEKGYDRVYMSKQLVGGRT